MRTKRCLASALGVGLVFSCGVFGQAMVEYGHGVAKAGVAGAASGTGLVGIFSTMKDTAEPKKKEPHSIAPKEEAKSEAAPDQAANASDGPANAPRKMTTSSGVVVSGVAPGWMSAAYSEPTHKAVRVKDVEWSNPVEDQAAAAAAASAATEPVVAEQAGEPGGTVPVVAAEPESETAPGPVVGYGPEYSSLARASAAPRGPRVESNDADIAGVRIGSKIDEVIEKLGRPSFTLIGVTGRNYTEKYLFKGADGETITVLTWSGVVTSVLLS